MPNTLKNRIEACWGQEPDAEAVEAVIAALDAGQLRVAEKIESE